MKSTIVNDSVAAWALMWQHGSAGVRYCCVPTLRSFYSNSSSRRNVQFRTNRYARVRRLVDEFSYRRVAESNYVVGVSICRNVEMKIRQKRVTRTSARYVSFPRMCCCRQCGAAVVVIIKVKSITAEANSIVGFYFRSWRRCHTLCCVCRLPERL